MAPGTDMIEVTELRMISDDRPSQWEGKVGASGSVYIRYRWGQLEVYYSEVKRLAVSTTGE